MSHNSVGTSMSYQGWRNRIFLRKTFYVFVPSPQSNLLKTTNPLEEFQLVYYSENIDFETFRRHYIWLGGDVSQMKHSGLQADNGRKVIKQKNSIYTPVRFQISLCIWLSNGD